MPQNCLIADKCTDLIRTGTGSSIVAVVPQMQFPQPSLLLFVDRLTVAALALTIVVTITCQHLDRPIRGPHALRATTADHSPMSTSSRSDTATTNVGTAISSLETDT